MYYIDIRIRETFVYKHTSTCYSQMTCFHLAVSVQIKSITDVKTPASVFIPSSSVTGIPNVPEMMTKTSPCVRIFMLETNWWPPLPAFGVHQKFTPIYPQSQPDATIFLSAIMMKMRSPVQKMLSWLK